MIFLTRVKLKAQIYIGFTLHGKHNTMEKTMININLHCRFLAY